LVKAVAFQASGPVINVYCIETEQANT